MWLPGRHLWSNRHECSDLQSSLVHNPEFVSQALVFKAVLHELVRERSLVTARA